MLGLSPDAKRLSRCVRLCATLVVLSGMLALPAGVQADRGHGREHPVVPAFGKLYDALSVAWWKYALEQPEASSPLLDETGERCAEGQSGPVFFLVGAAGTAERTRDECTVPAGKLLFFPLVNAFDVHVPPDGLDTPELVWDDFLVTLGFRVDTIYARVDGVPIRNLDVPTSPYRGCAAPVPGCVRPFSLDLPAGNIFQLPAGRYAPAVADGFYLLLAPLRPGRHTIEFGGTGYLGGAFAQDITYHLRVVPRAPWG